MRDFLDIQGKTLLITGGTSGIGKATCEQAIKFGARVIAVGRNTQSLEKLCTQFPNHVIPIKLDLFDENYKEKLKVALAHERIYGFLHAAGISPTMPFNREKREAWDRAMQLNVYSGVEIAQLLMKTQRSNLKSIVYVSSVMAVLAEKAKGTYSMSKGALNAVARNQALEYAKFKIRVNTLAPAVVNTSLSKESIYRKSEEAMKSVLAKHPLGLGEPTDIANAALFLISEASRWVTGTTLMVDGGYSIT